MTAAMQRTSGDRTLLASMALIVRYRGHRVVLATSVLAVGFLLGILLQEVFSKYGDLGAPMVVGIACAIVIAVCVALLLPALSLVVCVAVAFSNSSALLAVHYGLPVLGKYLPLVLLGVIALTWLREYLLELVPGRSTAGTATAAVGSEAFRLCLTLLLVYFLFTFLSTLYANEPALASEELSDQRKYLVLCLALALSIGRFGKWSSLPVVSLIALYATTAAVLMAVLASFHPPLQKLLPGFMFVYSGGDPGELSDRVAGAFGHPNTLGRYAVFMMPMALCIAWLSRGIYRALALGCLLILVVGMLLSESRGALLVLVILLLPASVLVLREVKMRHWLPGVLIASVVLVGAWQYVDVERMSRSVDDATRVVLDGDAPIDGATRGRLAEMRIAFELWKNHPLLGVGLANYEHYFQTYSYRFGTKLYNDDRAAHSLYLELLAERGIVGLVGYALAIGGILVAVLRTGLRRLRSERGATGYLVIAMVVSVTTYYLSAMMLHDVHTMPLWGLLGMLVASTRQPIDACGYKSGAIIRTSENH